MIDFTVHLKNSLRESSLLEPYYSIFIKKVGYDIFAMSLIKAKFGSNYQNIVGEKLRMI